MIYENLCIGCMREKHSPEEPCPYCGLDPARYQAAADLLMPLTVLNGKYLIGRVLGRGGFGVTYLGYNIALEHRVAIKEFFPSGVVSRTMGKETVSFYEGRSMETFHAGLGSFLAEGKQLARFSDVPGIVNVFDCFQENGTGYLVMEYLEGRTLLQELKQRGTMSWEEATGIIQQVLQGLAAIHRENLIHRDISPDNIFLLNDGRVKLLDFGSARTAFADRSKTMSVILKPGYAPLEQYNSHGKQGPWTDVYGVGATLYRMITGEKPLESTDRILGNALKRPSELGVRITPAQERTLMKSLELQERDRIRSADEFLALLRSERTGAEGHKGQAGAKTGQKHGPTQNTGDGSEKKRNQILKMAALTAAAAVFFVCGIAAIRFGGSALLKKFGFGNQAESQKHENDWLAFDASEYVTLGEYKGIEVPDSMVENQVLYTSSVKRSLAEKTAVSLDAGELQMGDLAKLTYIRTVDGEAESPVNTESLVNSDSWWFYEGGAKDLVGLSIGETRTLEYTYAESYYDLDLAGKTATWDVTLHSIRRPRGLTDELAAELSDGLTAEEYMDQICQECAHDKIVGRVTGYLMNQIAMDIEISSLPEEEFALYCAYYEAIYQQSYSEDAVSGLLEANYRKYMAYAAIAQREGLEPTEKEIQEKIQENADYVIEDAYRYVLAKQSLLVENVQQFLYDNAALPEGAEETVVTEEETADLYAQGTSYEAAGDYANAAICYGKAGTYQDAAARSMACWRNVTADENQTLAVGGDEAAVVREDGTLLSTFGETASWAALTGVAIGSSALVYGLQADGTIRTATGDDGWYYDDDVVEEVQTWTGVKAIAACSNDGLIAVKEDGTVIAAGENGDGALQVESWSDITAVSSSGSHTVGLRADGTAVAVGENTYGQCDVGDWTNLVAVVAGNDYTAGLTADGTVLIVGDSSNDLQEELEYAFPDNGEIVAISAGEDSLWCLKRDGTVAVLNGNYVWTEAMLEALSWTDLVAISTYTSDKMIIGVQVDGTVLAAGEDEYGQSLVSDWTDITDICVGSDFAAGLKSDGTVVAVGDNTYGQCEVDNWKDVVKIDADYSALMGVTSEGKWLTSGYFTFNTAWLVQWAQPCGSYGGLRQDGTALFLDGTDSLETWSDLTSVIREDTYGDLIVGLRQDGTVVVTGEVEIEEDTDNGYETVRYDAATYFQAVNSWTDICQIQVFTGFDYCVLVGRKTDGTLVFTDSEWEQRLQTGDGVASLGDTDNYFIAVRENGTVMVDEEDYWDSEMLEELYSWTDIVKVAAHYDDLVLGLKSDGTVVVVQEENPISEIRQWSTK